VSVVIQPGLTDDNDFIELLNLLLRNLVARQTPERLWVIQIDNWFDHKWMGFSGKGVVDFNFHGLAGRFDAALDEFRQDHLTFPPFTPNRVLSQWSFELNGNDLIEAPLINLPHATKRRTSNANLQRRVESFSSATLFVWFSGNTIKNDRASVMVYDLRFPQPDRWFASFLKRPVWRLQMTKGMDLKDVSSLLTPR